MIGCGRIGSAAADKAGAVGKRLPAAGKDVSGRTAHHGADRAAHALDGETLDRALPHDVPGDLRLVHCRARRVHHLHRSAAQKGAAAGAGTQFRQGRSYRHDLLLSSYTSAGDFPIANSGT
jgi:hypothetical protein